MKSNYFPTASQTIHYLEGGAGESLILLPSLYLTSKSYEKIGERLAKHYHVFILDLYKGKSKFTKPTVGVDDYCTVLEEFIKGQNIKEYYLIGISASGFVSSYFVRHTKLLPKKLFLFSTTYVPVKLGSMNVRLFRGYLKLFGHNIRSRKGMAINARWLTDSIPYFVRHPIQFFGEPSNKYPVEHAIQKSPCDTKLVLADADEFFGDLPVKKINSDVKRMSIEVVHGNHAWFFESPELFVYQIIKY